MFNNELDILILPLVNKYILNHIARSFAEDRLVAAALIPPNVVKMTDYQKSLTSQLAHGEDPWEVTRDEILLAADKNNKHHIQSVKDSFMKKEE